MTKSRNRNLIRVTSSNEFMKDKCVDLNDYNRYLQWCKQDFFLKTKTKTKSLSPKTKARPKPQKFFRAKTKTKTKTLSLVSTRTTLKRNISICHTSKWQ